MSERPEATERKLPSDFDAEQAVIGSMLLEPGAAAIAMSICSASDMYWEDHQTIYRAIEACHGENMPVDLVTVSHKLREWKKLERVGGGTYLTALISQVPTAAHVRRYANIVAGCGVKRKLIADLRALEDEAWSQGSDVMDITTAMIDQAVALMNDRFTGGQLRAWSERKEDIQALIEEAIKGKKPLSAPRLGIPGVDEMIGPLANHRLVVVKGGSGLGKTHLMVNAAGATALSLFERDDPRYVCIFSTESPGMYETRLLSWCSNVDNLKIIRGFDGERDTHSRDTLRAVGASITDLPIAIEDGEVTPERIEADLRRYAAKHGIAMVILDYLQDVQIDWDKDRRLEFVKLAYRLKHLSQDVYQVPFLISSQVTFNQGTGQWQAAESQQPQNTSTLTLRLDEQLKKGQAPGTGPLSLVGEKTRVGLTIGRVGIHMDKATSHVTMVDDHREEQPSGHDRF